MVNSSVKFACNCRCYIGSDGAFRLIRSNDFVGECSFYRSRQLNVYEAARAFFVTESRDKPAKLFLLSTGDHPDAAETALDTGLQEEWDFDEVGGLGVERFEDCRVQEPICGPTGRVRLRDGIAEVRGLYGRFLAQEDGKGGLDGFRLKDAPGDVVA